MTSPKADEYVDQIEILEKQDDVRKVQFDFRKLVSSYSNFGNDEKDNRKVIIDFYNAYAGDLGMQKDFREILHQQNRTIAGISRTYLGHEDHHWTVEESHQRSKT